MLAVRLPSPVVLAHAVISRTRRTKAGRMQSLRWVQEGNFAETKIVSSAHVMQCEEDAHLRGEDFRSCFGAAWRRSGDLRSHPALVALCVSGARKVIQGGRMR